MESGMQSDAFREAIFLASPELYAGNTSKDPKKQGKFAQSLTKYFLRATTRCTPFGLFAGCSMGRIGDDTKIELAATESYQRSTRLDMQYLCALIQEIERMPDIRRQLIYYPNDSLYKIGGKYRYIEYHYRKTQRLHSVASLEIDDALEQLLAVAAEGTTIEKLIQSLIDDQITREEAEAYINDVIDSQILKSELDPCVVGDDVFETLIEKLSHLSNVSVLASLQRVQTLLKKLDSLPLGTSLPVYSEIESLIKEIGVSYDMKYLFQTDLFMPVREAVISRQTTDRISHLIDFLSKISLPSQNTVLSDFAKAFQNRYEDMEMPLTVVMDRELGIGYPTSSNDSGDISPLVNDLVVPFQYSHLTETHQTPVDRVLFRKYIECIRNGEQVVQLTDDDFNKLEFTHQLSDTIAVMCNLLGEDMLNIKSIGGVCGGNLLGRFCHLDESMADLVQEITDFEQQRNPDVIYAEISHLPESRIGNIASRPAFRKYTLHYLSNFERDGNDIPITDLMLSVRRGRVVLRSKKYNKEVVPRLTCAHNYSMSPIPIYRFLCDLQYQGKTGGLNCGWNGLLSTYEYLPRIQYNNIILARQQWKIKQEEVKDFEKLSDIELDSKLKEFLQKRGIPNKVVIPDSDNELYLDLEDVQCQRLLMDEITKRKQITLEEFLFQPDNGLIHQGNNVYTNEAIIVFHQSK